MAAVLSKPPLQQIRHQLLIFEVDRSQVFGVPDPLYLCRQFNCGRGVEAVKPERSQRKEEKEHARFARKPRKRYVVEGVVCHASSVPP